MKNLKRWHIIMLLSSVGVGLISTLNKVDIESPSYSLPDPSQGWAIGYDPIKREHRYFRNRDGSRWKPGDPIPEPKGGGYKRIKSSTYEIDIEEVMDELDITY